MPVDSEAGQLTGRENAVGEPSPSDTMVQTMRALFRELLPEMIGNVRQLHQDGEHDPSSESVAGGKRPVDDVNDEHAKSGKTKTKIPKAGALAARSLNVKLLNSLAVVAKAIVTGLAVAASSRILNSSKVKDGALLLVASEDAEGDIAMEVFQMYEDGNTGKLAKVAASLKDDIPREQQVRVETFKVPNKFKGYWLTREGWAETEALADEEYFWKAKLIKKPWFPKAVTQEEDVVPGERLTLQERLRLKPSLNTTSSKPGDETKKIGQPEAQPVTGLYGNPGWYHIVSQDVIARSKRTQDLIAKDGEKATRANKHPERLENKGMNIYVLDILSIAPEYARDNPSGELCRQFAAKYQCPVCPAITVRVASEWTVQGKEGLRYYEDLSRIYGAKKGKLRMQSYLKEGTRRFHNFNIMTRKFWKDKCSSWYQ
jgi:hypothetical protein